VFSAEVGMTPKLFLRIRRFQRAFALAGEARTPAWAQLALDCGTDWRVWSGWLADFFGSPGSRGCRDCFQPTKKVLSEPPFL
jgi:hypothetical protein